MGKRYTDDKKRLIRELALQGCTDEFIALQLDCSTNAIRNIRHRTNIKTRETQTNQKLRENKQALQQTKQLEKELKQLTTKRNQIYQALQTEETQFNE